MLGAILGDIVGSPYEFDANNIKTEEFPLFCERSSFTDDTVMTIAVAQALMRALDEALPIGECVIESMRAWGRRYPDRGYGARFMRWLESSDPQPYNSWGNGSAMRVSPVGFLFESLEQVERAAAATAAVTHDHPEGIKGAQATASAVYLARCGDSKVMIRQCLEKSYGYDLSRTLADIRPGYTMDASCQGSVPQALIAFFESRGYEDALRKAVSVGGDSDTIACIAGGVAEAYYGMPGELRRAALRMLPSDMIEVAEQWHARLDGLRVLAQQRVIELGDALFA